VRRVTEGLGYRNLATVNKCSGLVFSWMGFLKMWSLLEKLDGAIEMKNKAERTDANLIAFHQFAWGARG
jgi:hypothetical protein